MDILTSTNIVVNTVKSLFEMASKTGNRDLLSKISELQGGIFETRQQALSLIDDNIKLRGKNRGARERTQINS